MTRQAMFDTMMAGWKAQGFKQSIDRGNCKYRAGGLKCIVGQLISDDEYLEEIDNGNYTVAKLFELGIAKNIKNLKGSKSETIRFLASMQMVHDCTDDDSIEETNRKIVERCRRYKVKVTEDQLLPTKEEA